MFIYVYTYVHHEQKVRGKSANLQSYLNVTVSLSMLDPVTAQLTQYTHAGMEIPTYSSTLGCQGLFRNTALYNEPINLDETNLDETLMILDC